MEEDSMSSSRSTAQACAACKYQRRKCGPKCILAPYFPHHRQKQFLHAHRLFGVGKITNLIKPLDPVRRNLAISTIIYESEMRAKDPVGGCLRIIQHLQSHLASAQAELQLLRQHLAFFKAQAPPPPLPPPPPPPLSSSSDPYLQQLSLQQELQQHHQQPQQQDQSFNYNSLQEDMKTWDLHNSLPFIPSLSSQDDISQYQDPFVGYGYDQKPGVLDLMDTINLDDG